MGNQSIPFWDKCHGHWLNTALRRKWSYRLEQRTFWTYHIMRHSGDPNSEHTLLVNGKIDCKKLCAFLAFFFVSQPAWLKQAHPRLHTHASQINFRLKTNHIRSGRCQWRSLWCLVLIREASRAHLVSITLLLSWHRGVKT